MNMRITRLILLILTVTVACEPVKYADKYGFLPGNDASANSDALQKCLDGGGKIRVRKTGVYPISKTLFMDSNTDLSFKEGVVLSKALGPDSLGARFVFINRGAITREYDENIRISGLNLRCNGLDSRSGNKLDVPTIVGLSCQLAFFYIKNLNINRANLTICRLPSKKFIDKAVLLHSAK